MEVRRRKTNRSKECTLRLPEGVYPFGGRQIGAAVFSCSSIGCVSFNRAMSFDRLRLGFHPGLMWTLSTEALFMAKSYLWRDPYPTLKTEGSFLTQWAAVTTKFFDKIDPPQMWLPCLFSIIWMRKFIQRYRINSWSVYGRSHGDNSYNDSIDTYLPRIFSLARLFSSDDFSTSGHRTATLHRMNLIKPEDQ